MNTLIVILGPTGVGKTELTLRIADFFHIPIINADSRQIFSEIPIGTAAPTPTQQQRVKHYFVGTHHLEDYYSASQYETDVLNLLKYLWKKDSIRDKNQCHSPTENHLALMSGGSMMYIDAVCNGIDDIPTIDDTTRKWMKQRLATEGLPLLVEELKQLDPEHWAIVDRNNPRRVVHALEICHMTGKTYTSFRTNRKKERPFHILKIGINLPRDILYKRINDRVLQMVTDGLVDEAHRVAPMKEKNALNTVGYKELFEHFSGAITLQEAIEQIQSHTRRYARKQLTWFKRDPSIHWFSPDQYEEIIEYLQSAIPDK